MNINHLAIFQAVAEAGSVSRGADALHISQPAVSKQLAEFEKNLGLRLFDRHAKGVRLTAAGEALHGCARRLFALEAEAEQAVAEMRGLTRGRLALGASTTIGAYLLPEVLGEFRRRFPGIALSLEIGNTDAIERGLRDGLFEVGLTEGLTKAPDLDAQAFHEDEIVAVAPPAHPLLTAANVTAAQLCAEPFIVREAGSGTRAVVEAALTARSLSLSNVVMSLGSTEAVKRAVTAEMGLAFVSRLTLDLELAAGRLAVIALADFSVPRLLHRLRARGRHPSHAARAFVSLLTEISERRRADA